MTSLAGTALIIGVLCFAVGATRPVILDYVDPSFAGSKLQLIRDSADQWQFANLLMGTAGIFAAVGVVIFSFALRQNPNDDSLPQFAVASAISVSLAAAFWMLVCYDRITITLPLARNPRISVWSNWAAPRYTVLMTCGIVLLGIIIMQGCSKWGGTLTMVAEVTAVSYLDIVFRDIIPGIHFGPLFIAGITLLVVARAGDRSDGMRVASGVPLDPAD